MRNPKSPAAVIQNLYSSVKSANDGGPWAVADMLRTSISTELNSLLSHVFAPTACVDYLEREQARESAGVRHQSVLSGS